MTDIVMKLRSLEHSDDPEVFRAAKLAADEIARLRQLLDGDERIVCGSCNWFDGGTCRRWPPHPEPYSVFAGASTGATKGAYSVYWPAVSAENDFCGEWLKRLTPKKGRGE